MFEFNPLKKLQGDFQGAFSLDHLQDGDDWLEEDGDKAEQKETIVHEISELGESESSDTVELKEVAHVVDTVKVVKVENNKKEEVPIPTPIPVPTPASNPTPISATSNQSPMEIASKVQQGISAASKVSTFFSLDTLQEDDAWMGPTKGMGKQSEEEQPARGGYDEDDSEEEDEVIPTPNISFQKNIAEEALAATRVNLPAQTHMSLLEMEEVPLEDASEEVDADKDVVKEDKSEPMWLPKYDRALSVKMEDDAQWKPPPPLPVVNPFANTYEVESIEASNPYLSGLRLSDQCEAQAPDSNLSTEVEHKEGGKHSWFRRTADRDSLRLMGSSLNMNTFLESMGLSEGRASSLDVEDRGSEHFLSSTPYDSLNSYRLPPMSSAMRATRAKIDHFGLLLEKERHSMSPHLAHLNDLVAGRARLSTVNKFQIAVVVVGVFLIYFYYTISDYFVLE